MQFIRRNAATVAVTAIFGLGILGSAAFAALAPATTPATDVLAGALNQAPKGDRIKAILDGLVARGVITQAQADAILAALQEDAREDKQREDKKRDDFAKRVYANLFEQSAAYLGIPAGELKAKLPGTSLAAIANATPGKSAGGLKAYLLDAVKAAIAKALADGNITQEQADRLTAAAPERIGSFVEHTYPKRDERPKQPVIKTFIGDALGTARDYLGLTLGELKTALGTGKSLGEIADATAGKSRDGLIAAITTSTNQKIDAAQQAGKLTADQATRLKAMVGDAVTRIVDAKRPIKSG